VKWLAELNPPMKQLAEQDELNQPVGHRGFVDTFVQSEHSWCHLCGVCSNLEVSTAHHVVRSATSPPVAPSLPSVASARSPDPAAAQLASARPSRSPSVRPSPKAPVVQFDLENSVLASAPRSDSSIVNEVNDLEEHMVTLMLGDDLSRQSSPKASRRTARKTTRRIDPNMLLSDSDEEEIPPIMVPRKFIFSLRPYESKTAEKETAQIDLCPFCNLSLHVTGKRTMNCCSVECVSSAHYKCVKKLNQTNNWLCNQHK
jgi:hypothetical protein